MDRRPRRVAAACRLRDRHAKNGAYDQQRLAPAGHYSATAQGGDVFDGHTRAPSEGDEVGRRGAAHQPRGSVHSRQQKPLNGQQLLIKPLEGQGLDAPVVLLLGEGTSSPPHLRCREWIVEQASSRFC